jgi:hypothetical protein
VELGRDEVAGARQQMGQAAVDERLGGIRGLQGRAGRQSGQRTGVTIYSVELFPRAAAEAAGATPVLALIPTPGDVDVLLASERMEAGRTSSG